MNCGNTYLYTRSSHYRVVYVYIGRFGIIFIQIWSQIKAVAFDGLNFLLHLSVKSNNGIKPLYKCLVTLSLLVLVRD